MNAHTASSLSFAILAMLFISPVSNASENVVTWKNGAITSNELVGDLLRIPSDKRQDTKTNPQAMAQLMDNIHVYKELAARAKSAGIDREPLVAANLDIASARALGNIFMGRLLDEEQKRLGDFTDAAREHYKLNENTFQNNEKVAASHILIAKKTRTESELAQISAMVRKRALSGEDFSALAGEFSDDVGSRQKGGALGEFERGVMVAEFEQAVFALQKSGDISDIVKTQFGHHIIKLTKRTPAGKKPFEEAKESIVAELKEKAISRYREEYLAKIRADTSIKINDEAFETIVGTKRLKK